MWVSGTEGAFLFRFLDQETKKQDILAHSLLPSLSTLDHSKIPPLPQNSLKTNHDLIKKAFISLSLSRTHTHTQRLAVHTVLPNKYMTLTLVSLATVSKVARPESPTFCPRPHLKLMCLNKSFDCTSKKGFHFDTKYGESLRYW